DNKKEKTIAISLKNGIRKIELSKLLYIEVLNHDLIYHTIDEKIESRGTMREMEEALAKEHFFRCSKCYLVNLEHVNKVDDLSVTVGSDILQISRLKKKQFMDELNKFMNE
ncbi:MAG: LytTR family transcriptional regulator, partial [Lachnospiraceae bacterium]|nr:LytTR family transcriptional regulator [Lachnospiraceae bacterium]